MHYFIDGYNMLFRVLRAGDDLRTQRDALIEDLKIKIKLLQLDITLVFDSQYHPDEGSIARIGTLKIIFTSHGETADEYILQELKELHSPTQHTVVTSDKKLAWLSRRRVVNTESVEDFISWLNKRYKNKLRQLKQKSLPKDKGQKPSDGTTGLRPLLRPSPPKADPIPPSSDQSPKKETSTEECYDYYLKVFQEGVQAESEKKTEKRVLRKEQKKGKKKTGKPASSSEDAVISDMERWQRAFES